MVYFLCYIHIRNSGDTERWFDCDEYRTQEEALKDAIDKIYYFHNDTNFAEEFSEKEKEILISHLKKGKSVWIWEWERKSSGDKIWIVEDDDVYEEDYFDEENWTCSPEERGPEICEILHRK